MLERVPTILTAQEILDKAFHKAAKIDIPDPVKYHRVRKEMVARIKTSSEIVSDTLHKYVKSFPDMDHLRDYEMELLDIVVGIHDLKRAIGSVDWAKQKARDLADDHLARAAKIRDIPSFHGILKRHYGRLSSVVYEIDKSLALMRDTRDKMKMLPTVHPGQPTVVIAGFPNVGKTSLLRAWTNSKARVDNYSFTTQHADVGHIEVPGKDNQPQRVQVVDTPGILDRPDEERNDVERQAVAALRYASDAVVFLIDPTERCGYSLEAQEKLLAQTQEEMVGLPMLVAETKADLARTDTDRLRFSTTTGEGLDALRHAILAMLPLEEPELEEDPLDAWKKP